MIKHLFKMVWNRKRANFLIGVELFLSFLVLCAVLTVCTYFLDNYRRPLGFSYDDVWHIEIAHSTTRGDEEQLKSQILLTLSTLDEIEAAAYVAEVPFGDDFDGVSIFSDDGKRILNRGNWVTDGLGKVLDLEIVDGRWFNREDEGLKGDAVVINEELAKLLFGLESPVGKDIRRWNAELLESRFAGDLAKATTYKVVGVVADFRGDDFAPSTPFVFRRVGLGDDYVPSDLLVRLRPGTKAVFGEKLLARLQSVVQDWRFSITPLSDHRTTNFKLYLSFITIGGFVAGLLIVMVSLGMMGVLWQNVTQRINEIGLRRALGGATRYIAAQFLGELLVVTTISVVFALAIIVQFPLNDAIEFVHREIYLGGIFAAILLMYLLVTICALYPSWLASRVQPAEALHHE